MDGIGIEALCSHGASVAVRAILMRSFLSIYAKALLMSKGTRPDFRHFSFLDTIVGGQISL
jgi:hypothetical protein